MIDKLVIVPSVGVWDCDECYFALDCIEPCNLKKGRHYEKVKPKTKRK
jgi:hypothetical protein